MKRAREEMKRDKERRERTCRKDINGKRVRE
jgi:hypothetical protein